jgi:sn-glycerol 3-phosphate transport system substrate-binding protein
MLRTHRLTLAALLLAAFALIAAACGGGDDGGSSPDDSTGGGGGDEVAADLPECPLGALEEAEGPVDITLWHAATAANKEALEALVAEYNASQDQVVVTAEGVGVAAEELSRVYNQNIASGELPAIAIFEDTQTQYLSDTDTILPATACFQAGAEQPDWLPVIEPSFTVDGAMWPSAVNLTSPIMYFNVGHFEDAGLDPEDPPQTLDEVRDAAQAIRNAGISETPFVFLVNPWYLETWMTGIGQSIVNEDNGRSGVATEATLDNDNVVEVLTWLQGMQDDGLMNSIRQGPGVVDQFLALGTGGGSMLIETSTASVSVEGFLEGSLDASELTEDGRVPAGLDTELRADAAPLPGVEEAGQAQVGGGIWMITSTTPPEQQAAAWDFMEWWNTLPTQVSWNLDGGSLPSVQGASEDPELQETWENTLSGQWLATAYEQLAAVSPDEAGPAIGPYFDVRSEIRSEMEAVIFDGKDPAEAAAAMQDAVTEVLATYEEENF